MLERFFRLKENGTTVRVEFIGGATTFMTMAYIVFVNPGTLSDVNGAAMSFDAVAAATCLSAAIGTLLMAFLAKYPVALAPGLGLNAYFSFTICGAMGVPWDIALGIVFISGAVFTLLTVVRGRQMILTAIPASLKLATAAGIGLFIAFIGLKDAGIIEQHPATFVTLGDLGKPPTLLALFGLVLTAVLLSAKVKGAILWGILVTGLAGILFNLVNFTGLVALPNLAPTAFKFRPLAALRLEYLTPIVVLLFFDMFDTVGTLIGVGEEAGLMKDGRLPRATPALLSDSIATMSGAILGTSTVTSYVESAAGVSAGARTGLASVFTAILFLVALFFSPLAQMFGGGYQVQGGMLLHPITAPALVVVGCFMMKSVAKIPWDDYSEAIPAFLTVVIMPLTSSIAHGLAIGFISYPIIKGLSGKARDVHWLVYLLAGIFILRYIFI